MTEEAVVEKNNQENTENGNKHEEISDLEDAIINQVLYYFGDANLPRDKFLREQVKLDEGWVPLEVLTTFNRLAKLTKDIEVIANALNKASSGLIEVSEDNKKVRRSPEMPVPELNEERRKELLGRTIYAKGFPKDSVLDDLMKYFKEHGELENLIMRRYLDKPTKKRMFKGSVFATFKEKEKAEAFVSTKGLKCGESELLVLWQENYLTAKQEEYQARKEKKDQKNRDNKPKEESKSDIKLPSGAILHFSENVESLSREEIKEALTNLGAEVAFIDYTKGDKEGWARLTKEDAAKEIITKIPDGKMKVQDHEVSFRVLEGDEEKLMLEKAFDEMSKRRKNAKTSRFGKGNRNFKGKPQNRKRKQFNHPDEPRSKVKAD